jgi:DNA-binding response OmpR family regulator
VVARIRAVTRRCLSAPGKQRSTPADQAPFQMEDLTIYPAELRARRGRVTIELSLRDLKILALLFEHRGCVLDRNTIFNHCWGEDYFPDSRSLDQHISQLRKRIEVDPKAPVIIRTVHGVGYRFE